MYSKQILHSSEPNAMSDSFCVENWFVTQIIWILQHRQAAYIKGKKCFDNGSLLRSSIVALKSVYGTKDEIKVSLKRFIRKTWLMIDSGGLKQFGGRIRTVSIDNVTFALGPFFNALFDVNDNL